MSKYPSAAAFHHCPACLSPMAPSATPANEPTLECTTCGKVVAAAVAADACLSAVEVATERARLTSWARGAAILDGAAYSDLAA